jgi:radical SAM superfamily enzyme YgiQ (UPF0313 family)
VKVTLIYPGIAQIGFNSLCKGTPATNLVGLGLAYLGASIKEKSNHKVDLIDLREMRDWDHFTAELRSRESDLVGIYVNTVNYDFAVKCAEIARGLKKKVVGGGPHATLSPTALLDTGFFDHIIKGESEITFPKVLADLESGKEVGCEVHGESVTNLDNIPFPARDLYNMNKILNSPGIFPYPHRYIGIITSRGCPFSCSFCQPMEKNLFGKKTRQRSLSIVIYEVEYVIDKYKANFIMFQDSVLTIRKSWVLELCEKMDNLGIRWGCQTRVDTIDEDTIRALSEGGCVVIMFGFESGSERILKLLGKRTLPEQALEAVRLCRKYDIMVFANYMLGVPTETISDLEDTLYMLKKIRPEIHAPSYFSPIPGSDLYEYCRDRDLIIADRYESLVRSAFGSKIKGINYKQLDVFRKKMGKWKTPWYKQKNYALCLFRRWLELLKEGFTFQIVKEFLLLSPLLEIPIKRVLRVIR